MRQSGTLNLATAAQKALFTHELVGQMSDGAWENTAPFDHWEVWASCAVKVDPTNVGRDFYARKTGYAFAKALLDIECIKTRMLAYARWAITFGEDVDADALECLRPDGTLSSWASPATVAYLRDFDPAKVLAVASDESLYNERDLRRDLTAINKALKVRVA